MRGRRRDPSATRGTSTARQAGVTRRRAVVLAALVAFACDGGDANGRAAASGAAADSRTGAAASGAAEGALVLGDASYPFTVRTCDPDGTDPNGVTLRGHGTAPDGRRLAIEIERIPPADPGGRLEHNAFVLFGSVMDGEAWSAKRVRTAEGEWREGELGDEAAPGPLVEVEGRRISVRGTLQREGGEERVEADLEVSCPS